MTDVFLYPGQANPNDVRLTDPTQLSSSSITGSGVLVCGAAIILGIALSFSTGTGSLSAQAATIAGEGTVSSLLTVTGEGALLAQSATLSGVGTSKSTGTGALASQAATLTGVGTGLSTGSGALAAQSASSSGVGTAYWKARSEPYLNEDGINHYLIEEGTGRYAIEEVRIIAGSAQISGEGEVTGGVPRETIRNFEEFSLRNWRKWHRPEERLKTLGIEPKAAEIIADVAARQVSDLHLDEQQRLEELRGEMRLQGMEMQTRHLEALNDEREQLIHAEIKALLLQKLDKEAIEALMMIAAVI